MMKKEKMKKSIIVAYAVLILSAVLFVTTAVSLIRNANAELNIRSDEFEPDFQMYHIGVTLNENGEPLAWRNYSEEDYQWHVNAEAVLLGNVNARIGQQYDEVLTVSNSGTIDEYVRVTIYKYWEEETDGGSKAATENKNRDLNPAYIVLNLVNVDAEHWIVDRNYSTDERTVLYYAYPLTKSVDGYFDEENGTTVPFADKFYIDPAVKTFVYQERETDAQTGYTTVTNYYLYDGRTFCVEVQVDGVQTHNPEEAIRSAWGRKVSIDEETGRLALEGE